MDGDGGGMDAGGMGGMTGSEMGGTAGDGEAGMGSMDGNPPDSRPGVLESIGYIDSGAGMDKMDGDSTGSGTSDFQSIINKAVVALFGFCFLFLLLKGILAMFGVQV